MPSCHNSVFLRNNFDEDLLLFLGIDDEDELEAPELLVVGADDDDELGAVLVRLDLQLIPLLELPTDMSSSTGR